MIHYQSATVVGYKYDGSIYLDIGNTTITAKPDRFNAGIPLIGDEVEYYSDSDEYFYEYSGYILNLSHFRELLIGPSKEINWIEEGF